MAALRRASLQACGMSIDFVAACWAISGRQDLLRGLLNLCRVQKMPYPPPIPLPVPTAVQPRPDGIPGLTLDALELMSDEEAQSNEQLYHSVWLLHLSRHPAHTCGSQCTAA